MRQKDFNEVARVLGNEVRTCDEPERDGLYAGYWALMGHADHVYPDVSREQMMANFEQGRMRGL